MTSKNCTKCGKSGLLRNCPCGKANYCNKDCQVADWPTHKLTHSKIKVVLLGENHIDEECFSDNAEKLCEILVANGKPMNKQDFLLISEGKGINMCYQVMRLPIDRIIIEDDQSSPPLESMTDIMLLLQQVVFAIKNGELREGMYMGGAILTKKFILDRTSEFNELLKSIDCEQLYKDMINNAFENKDVNNIFKEILTRILRMFDSSAVASSGGGGTDMSAVASSSSGGDSASSGTDMSGVASSGGGGGGASSDPDNVDYKIICTMLNDLITQNTYTAYANFLPLLQYLRETRDKKIIKRVEDRIKTEPSIKIVVIIFGQKHFENLKKLIQESRYLKFDSTNSMQLKGYRTKYLKYKQKYLSLKNFNKNN